MKMNSDEPCWEKTRGKRVCKMNASLKAWVQHEEARRFLNRIFVLLAVLSILFAVTVWPGGLLILPLILVCAGISNVYMLADRPHLFATEEEIRCLSEGGPAWFRKLIHDHKPSTVSKDDEAVS